MQGGSSQTVSMQETNKAQLGLRMGNMVGGTENKRWVVDEQVVDQSNLVGSHIVPDNNTPGLLCSTMCSVSRNVLRKSLVVGTNDLMEMEDALPANDCDVMLSLRWSETLRIIQWHMMFSSSYSQPVNSSSLIT